MLRILDVARSGTNTDPIPFFELASVRERVLMSIKEYMYSGIFKHPTGALAASINGYVRGQSIFILSELPYAETQDKGILPHVQWYLMGKVVPIRIHRFGGTKVIYRKATLKSFLEGKWVHPGITPKEFIKKGVDQFLAEAEGYRITTRTPRGIVE